MSDLRWMRWAVLAMVSLGAGCSAKKLEAEALANPQDPQAWVTLGDAYARAGRTDQARAAYSQALSLDPTNTEIQTLVNETVGGREVRKIRKLIFEYPDSDEAWGRAGVMAYEAGYNGLAVQYLQQAISMDPQDGEWLYYLALLMEPEPFMEMGRALIGAYPENDELIGKVAWSFFEMEGGVHREEACALFEQALAIDPVDPEWTEGRNQCNDSGYLSEVSLDWMEAEVESCVEVEGAALNLSGVTDPEVLSTIADALLAGGARDQALTVYRTLLRVEPGPDAVRSVALLEGKTALTVLEELVAEAPTDWRRQMALGDHRAALGDREGALSAWKEALKQNPTSPELRARVSQATPPTPPEGSP